MPHPQRITFYDALAELALARLGPPIATQQHTTEETGVNADQSQDGISGRHANEGRKDDNASEAIPQAEPQPVTPTKTHPQKQPQDISEKDATPMNKTPDATTRGKAKGPKTVYRREVGGRNVSTISSQRQTY